MRQACPNATCASGWAAWWPGGSSNTTPPRQTYFLPREHAAVLTRAAGPDNLARVAQFIPLLGEVEQKIIGCFRNGGGLSYSDYPRFHTLMAEQSGEVFDAALVDVILPLVGGLPERLLARRRRRRYRLRQWACRQRDGAGVIRPAGSPASTSPRKAWASVPTEAERLGARPTRRSWRAMWPQSTMTDAYDVITAFDAIHDQAQPARVLENIHRALRPGGVFLMVDIKASSNARGQRRCAVRHRTSTPSRRCTA